MSCPAANVLIPKEVVLICKCQFDSHSHGRLSPRLNLQVHI